MTLPDLVADAGDSVAGTITLDAVSTTQGYSLGFCYDTSILTVTSVTNGADVAAVNNGQGPGFFTIDMPPGAVTIGVVVSLLGTATLPAGTGIEIVDFTLQSDFSATGVSPLSFCVAGAPAVQTIVVLNGAQQSPATVDGSIDFTPPPPPLEEFERGDCNSDGSSNIADAITLLGNLFPNGAPTPLPCPDACDSNDDGGLNIADAIALLAVLFQGAPAVEPVACGPDPTDTDPLECPTSGNCP